MMSWDVCGRARPPLGPCPPPHVNVAFQQSAYKVLLDDDNLLPLLHLTIEYHGKEHKGLPCFHVSSGCCWSAVSSASPSTSAETV